MSRLHTWVCLCWNRAIDTGPRVALSGISDLSSLDGQALRARKRTTLPEQRENVALVCVRCGPPDIPSAGERFRTHRLPVFHPCRLQTLRRLVSARSRPQGKWEPCHERFKTSRTRTARRGGRARRRARQSAWGSRRRSSRECGRPCRR